MKDQLFMPILAASFAGHIVLLVAGGLMPNADYAVQKAPSSVDIVIAQEVKVPVEQNEEIREILQAKIPIAKEKESVSKKEIENILPTPPEKGARVEAKPDAVRNPAPVYPRLARQNGWEGTVILKVLVEKDGQPSSVQIEKSSGYDSLDQSALHTVKQWQFVPARVGNLPFRSWLTIPIRFVLTAR